MTKKMITVTMKQQKVAMTMTTIITTIFENLDSFVKNANYAIESFKWLKQKILMNRNCNKT